MNKQSAIRYITHFVAFQNPSPKLMAEIYEAILECFEHGLTKKLYEICEKVKLLKTNDSTTFSFFGKNKWKYICSILLEVYGSRYVHGKHTIVIHELMGYLIGSVRESRVIDLSQTIICDQLEMINKVINLTDDEFAKLA